MTLAAASPVRVGRKFLGEILVETGKVSPADLERALQLQQGNRERLGKLLIDLGAIAERDLLSALSQQLGVPVIDGAQFPSLAPEIKSLAPRFMRAAKFFPFELQENRVLVAMADPLDFETLDSIRLATGLEPVAHLALDAEVQDAIEKSFGNGGGGEAGRESFGDGTVFEEGASEDVEHLRDLALEAPVIRLVNLLIARAVETR